jgi:hypothetical protein
MSNFLSDFAAATNIVPDQRKPYLRVTGRNDVNDSTYIYKGIESIFKKRN